MGTSTEEEGRNKRTTDSGRGSSKEESLQIYLLFYSEIIRIKYKNKSISTTTDSCSLLLIASLHIIHCLHEARCSVVCQIHISIIVLFNLLHLPFSLLFLFFFLLSFASCFSCSLSCFYSSSIPPTPRLHHSIDIVSHFSYHIVIAHLQAELFYIVFISFYFILIPSFHLCLYTPFRFYFLRSYSVLILFLAHFLSSARISHRLLVQHYTA